MKFASPCNDIIINEIESLEDLLSNGSSLKNCTLQNIDLSKLEIDWDAVEIDNTLFLGCTIQDESQIHLIKRGAVLIPKPKGLPYNPFRQSLYHWKELLEKADTSLDETIDLAIYEHFSCSKFNPSINEALWQRIHDHAMDDALRDLLKPDGDGNTQKRSIGFMGGHGTLRTDPFFIRSAHAARLLSLENYFIASGGGPGIMEAANLGAYFGAYSKEELDDALKILGEAPHYTDENYIELAQSVIHKYPDGKESLAIPTWFYGHEPSNLFAHHIAKYFSNSIREDTLISICIQGIVFAPGSAGTTQEIFMDAAQNHYGSFNYYSPMVFLGKKRYQEETSIFQLLTELAQEKKYSQLLFLTDEPKEVLDFIKNNPPIKAVAT